MEKNLTPPRYPRSAAQRGPTSRSRVSDLPAAPEQAGMRIGVISSKASLSGHFSFCRATLLALRYHAIFNTFQSPRFLPLITHYFSLITLLARQVDPLPAEDRKIENQRAIHNVGAYVERLAEAQCRDFSRGMSGSQEV